ncbi:hypothetical protein BKI52_30170 [marine bacterium AO1-C]|nr:hypothetical protein BKI52_30170 [marine bacterium AO1-C]
MTEQGFVVDLAWMVTRGKEVGRLLLIKNSKLPEDLELVCIPDVPSRMGGIARYTLLGVVFQFID